MIPTESETTDDLWYVSNHQGSTLARGPPPILYANDIYMNTANLQNARVLPSDSIPSQSSPDLASIIAHRQRDVLQRMANKAERARRSRKKRKAYVSDLETQAQMLSEQLRSLSAEEIQLNSRVAELSQENRVVTKNIEIEQQIENSLDALRQEQHELIEAIESLLREVKDDDPEQPLSELILKLLQNCRSIWSSFNAYMNLAECTVNFGRGNPSDALWLLFTSTTHSDELRSLLNLSEDQCLKLDSFRIRFDILKAKLADVSRLLHDYRSHCESMLNIRDQEIREIINIIGPYDCSRILSWVQKQTWCMELLNSLFPNYIASSLDQEVIISS